MTPADTAVAPLTMSWRQLAFLNWRVPAPVLQPHVPAGTTLDLFDGSGIVSVVGLLYADVRVMRLPIPIGDFAGLNVRFYVRRDTGGEVRRGVVFLRELAALPAIPLPPRALFNEPIEARRLTHEHRFDPSRDGSFPTHVEYRWEEAGGWGRIAVQPADDRLPLSSGSEREFVTERYHAYTRQEDGSTVEYAVRHRAWEVRRAAQWTLVGDLAALAGADVGAAIGGAPHSAFLADGAPVSLHLPTRIA